jgi:hypothetical protein
MFSLISCPDQVKNKILVSFVYPVKFCEADSKRDLTGVSSWFIFDLIHSETLIGLRLKERKWITLSLHQDNGAARHGKCVRPPGQATGSLRNKKLHLGAFSPWHNLPNGQDPESLRV